MKRVQLTREYRRFSITNGCHWRLVIRHHRDNAMITLTNKVVSSLTIASTNKIAFNLRKTVLKKYVPQLLKRLFPGMLPSLRQTIQLIWV